MIIEIKIPASFENVNTNDLGELIWWAAHLGLGPENLLSIIDKVGTATENIRKYSQLKIKEPQNEVTLLPK